MSLSFCDHVASDVYWASRKDHPDYPELAFLVDEAHRMRRAVSTSSELSKAENAAARTLASQMSDWEQRTDHPFGIFDCCAGFAIGSDEECVPLVMWREELYVLEMEEHRNGRFICSYRRFLF